ncbi:uncharacterized protein LOC34619766 [Cyclospora cayetanensis]|uniref:Uncharacterized protein LOC34619766 n=1 Tax=Cyclospora cayetanensis TaxID=88456 RepID=A0A6P6RWF0_9EIME|nr:uncharacterized protein LOC34619766 [Cyclospora cayetanensis]
MWLWTGASSASLQRDVTEVPKQDFYSADHMLALLDSLPSYETVDDKNRDYTIETLRQIAEVLVWGEQHNRGYFDIFCEQNVLSYFVQLAERPTVPNAVKVQLLQTLSIIVQSINKETAVYYMFSNNYINSLLSTKFDFEDEEVASWYISFIKSLSMLVNPATIKLFLNERAKHFPLYSEAVKFFIAKDSMIRTHCRNVTLTLFRVKDPAIRAFLVERPIFFSHVACYLREVLNRQFSRLTANGATAPDLAIQDGALEIEEMLFYIQDIFSLNVEEFSELLAARLLIHCYLPVIGLMGKSVASRTESGHAGLVKAGASANNTPESEIQLSESSEEEMNTSLSSENTGGEGSPGGEKRMEQGWMAGWSTLDDLKDTTFGDGGKDSHEGNPRSSLVQRNDAKELTTSWRARAAQAMAVHLDDVQQENSLLHQNEATCSVGKLASSSTSHSHKRHPQDLLHDTYNFDPAQRMILFFLMQTFNCVQSELLLRPILAALLFHRLPKPFHDLLLGKDLDVPEAYNNLRNPTDCAGHIEMFLPSDGVPSGSEVQRIDYQRHGQSDTTDKVEGPDQGAGAQSQSSKHESLEQPSAFSFDDRLKMLEASMKVFTELGFFGEPPGTAYACREGEIHQGGETKAGHPEIVNRNLESFDDLKVGSEDTWCDNPIRQFLLTLVDGSGLAERQCDTSFLLLAILVQSVLSHSVKAAVRLKGPCRICLVPLFVAAQVPGTMRSRTPDDANNLCSMRRLGPTSGYPISKDATATQEENCLPERTTWSGMVSQDRNSALSSEYCARSAASVPSIQAPSMHPESFSDTLFEACGSANCGQMCWSFIEKMLDAIQKNLSNTLLRSITVRVALSALAAFITNYVLKVQPLEFRIRCTEVLVDRALKLRRSAAVATKRCLAETLDSHIIDVFWDEWEMHRAGAINDSAFARNLRILCSPPSSQTSRANCDFPPYLLVAMTDQEIERRSIQLFLLLRRLHRDLQTILQSIGSTPGKASDATQEAFSILYGESLEPNPFESEDCAHLRAQGDSCASKLPEAKSRTSISLEGRNIIRCSVETASGPATRYCVQDDKRLLLVSPSSTLPGFADIRTSHPLRNVECRLRKNSSRCMQLLVLDVAPPSDGLSRSPSSGLSENPPTMRVSLTAPPLKKCVEMERPALWEIRLQFADAVRCNLVFHILQKARAIVRRTLASRIDELLEEI